MVKIRSYSWGMAALHLLMLVQGFALMVNSLAQKEDFGFDLSPAVRG